MIRYSVLLGSLCTNFQRDNSVIWENLSLPLLENVNYVSDNVNLVLNTYKCILFQIPVENIWCCWTASTKAGESTRQGWNGKGLESATFEIHKSIVTKNDWRMDDWRLIGTGSFPNELTLADVTPVFKKENPLKLKNYRPVSVLPVVSKILERIMHKPMSLHVDNFLSPLSIWLQKRI